MFDFILSQVVSNIWKLWLKEFLVCFLSDFARFQCSPNRNCPGIQGKVSWRETIGKSSHIFESFCQKGALFPLVGYIWGWFTQICLPALLWEVPSLVMCCSFLWKKGLTSGYPPCFQVKCFSSFLSLSCVSSIWARAGYLRCDREPKDKARHKVSSSCVTLARKQRSVAWLRVGWVAMLMCQSTSGSKGWKNTKQ